MRTVDYFTYLPENRLGDALGCTALSTGYTRVAPGSAYPPARHPDDHHFVWERGRTLQAYQFALISEGRGQLQSAPNPATIHEVEAGDVMLMYPGVWHRFAPDTRTGWVESWIECRGAALDRVFAMGLMPLEVPIWRAGPLAESIFSTVHELARQDAILHQPTLSALGLQLVAQLCQSRDLAEQGRVRLVEQARRAMIEMSGEPLALETVASELGLSYSTLRRLFRRHVGVSLKQYQTEVRIRRACELLRNSDRPIKAIAGHLGYSSPFHFSAQFRRSTGLAPSEWREQNRSEAI